MTKRLNPSHTFTLAKAMAEAKQLLAEMNAIAGKDK